MRRLGTDALWGVYARAYDQLWDNELTDRTAAFLMALIEPGSLVLEVGAGTGLYTARLIRGGFVVRACEPDRHMYERAIQRLPDAAVEFVSGEEWAPQVSGSVVVVAVNVVHMARDPLDLIGRMRVLAGDDGRVIVVTPEPEGTLRSVAWAQLRLGVPFWRVWRFVLWHVLLGPWARLTGMAAKREHLAWADAPGECGFREPSGSGVFRILVFTGDGAKTVSAKHA